MEDALFADDVLLDRLESAKQSLLQREANGSLAPALSEALAAQCARSPKLAQELAHARATEAAHNATARHENKILRPAANWRWRFGMAFASIVLLAITLGGVWQIHRAATAIAPAQPVPASAVAPARAATVLFLSADTFRGAVASPVLAAPPADAPVDLQVQVRSDTCKHWNVAVRQQDRAVFTANNLSVLRQGSIQYVEARLPAVKLIPGSYRLALTCVDGDLTVTRDLSLSR